MCLSVDVSLAQLETSLGVLTGYWGNKHRDAQR